jgi:hypothetical protein
LTTEQLNIEGKRSGDGFVAHREAIIKSLSAAQAARVALLDGDVTIGRKGLLNYLKALGGNFVKLIPSSGSASGLRATDKGLKVVCGSHQSFIPGDAWIGEKTPISFCQVRVSPNNTVYPNISGIELAEALARVIPFASKEENRPVLQCVKATQRDGKLTLVASDGFRLAMVSLDFEDGEGEALVNASELAGLIPALRKAKRIRLGFQNGGEKLASCSLILDTELIRYKWQSQDGAYPDYEKVIPSEFVATATFDTKEASKASRSLTAIWYDDSLKKEYRPITLTIGDGKVILEAKEDRGKAEIEADTSGEVKTAVSARYLAQVLKACGGMVELKASSPSSPMMFSVDGYRLLVMPMATEDTVKAKGDAIAQAEKVAERATTKAKPKRKRKGKAEEVAEAKEDEAVGLPPDEAREPAYATA